jgi:hypothetical protein
MRRTSTLRRSSCRALRHVWHRFYMVKHGIHDVSSADHNAWRSTAVELRPPPRGRDWSRLEHNHLRPACSAGEPRPKIIRARHAPTTSSNSVSHWVTGLVSSPRARSAELYGGPARKYGGANRARTGCSALPLGHSLTGEAHGARAFGLRSLPVRRAPAAGLTEDDVHAGCVVANRESWAAGELAELAAARAIGEHL